VVLTASPQAPDDVEAPRTDGAVQGEGSVVVAVSPRRLLDEWATGTPEQIRYLRTVLEGTDPLRVSRHTLAALQEAKVDLVPRAGIVRLLHNPRFLAYATVFIYSSLRALPAVYAPGFRGNPWVLWAIDIITAVPYTWGIIAMVAGKRRRIRFAGGTNRWARDLYLRAFPEDERIPWALIHVLSLRRGVDLVAWWDQPAGPTRAARPDPVALTWTVRRPGSRLLYLFYLAVDDAARGRGVGTRLLAELERRHPGCTIVLNIEPVIAEADNAEQRRRRFSFYERSGFRDTGYAVQDSTGEYWTLAREAPGTTFDPDDFRDALSCLDCGLITARVAPRPQT